MRVTLGGAEVDLLHHDEVLAEVRHHLDAAEEPLAFTFVTLEHLYQFGVDSGRAGFFDREEGGPDWRVLASNPAAARTARRMTGVWWERIEPADLLPDVLSAASRARARVGVVGGSPEDVAMIENSILDRFSDIRGVRTWAPERTQVDDPAHAHALASEIQRHDIDLLIVALGKPRQETWLKHYASEAGVRVALAVGSATDLLRAVGVPSSASQNLAERIGAVVHEPGTVLNRLVRDPVNLIRLATQSPTDQFEQSTTRERPTPLLASPARWRRRFARSLVFADASAIALSSVLAYVLRSQLGRLTALTEFQNEVPVAFAVLPLWLAILYGMGNYRPEHFNRGGDVLRRFAAGTVLGVFALGFVSFALNLQLSRIYVFTVAVGVFIVGALVRVGAHRFVVTQHRRGRLIRDVLIVGVDEASREVAQAMRRSDASGYRVVGFLDDDLRPGATVAEGLEVLGSPEDVVDIAYDVRAGLVVVAPSAIPDGMLQEITVALEGTSVDLAVAPSLFQVVSQRVTMESIDNVPVLHIDQIRLRGFRAATKRALDLVVATSLLVLLWPVMLGAAVAISIETGRPVLFRQERVGRDGARLSMLKFRTMVPDAEVRLEEVAELNEAGHRFFKIREDPRVTRAGRLLRKWSIDETPQLWNVLRGDMSMVGPRPPLPTEVEKYEPWHRRRLRIRPGITGIWQVSGRSDVPFDEAVRMDLFYIENWSLGLDLYLLAKTIPAVLGRRGAY